MSLHMLKILLFTSSTNDKATLLLNTITDVMTSNDIHFVAPSASHELPKPQLLIDFCFLTNRSHRHVKWLHRNYHLLM